MATPTQVHELIRKTVHEQDIDGKEQILNAVDRLFEAEAELVRLGYTCLSDPWIVGLLSMPPATERNLH